MNIFDHYRQRYEAAKDEEFTLQEFSYHLSARSQCLCQCGQERLLMAIGEPNMVDTALETPAFPSLFESGGRPLPGV